jgi:hypothetical protein
MPKRIKARGEFVWVHNGVGLNGEYPAQLVIPMKEMKMNEMEDDDEVEVRFTTSGRYEWVAHSSIEYPKEEEKDEEDNNDNKTKKTASPVAKTTPTRRRSTRKRTPASKNTSTTKNASRKRSEPDEEGMARDNDKKPKGSSASKKETKDKSSGEPSAKRQKTTDNTSIFENLTAPLVIIGKTIATEISGFYNGLFRSSSSEGK